MFGGLNLTLMPIIKFKATRRNAMSCDGYRQLVKSGDLVYDVARESDDTLIIYKESLKDQGIIIDCDKKTGEFSIKF